MSRRGTLREEEGELPTSVAFKRGSILKQRNGGSYCPVSGGGPCSASSHLIEFHRPFFLMGFYLCIIPYRLVREGPVGVFVMRGNKFQAVACVLIHILIGYEYFSIVRIIRLDAIDGTPKSYLHVATIFASLLYFAFFIYVFWSKESLWKSLFKDMQQLSFVSPFVHNDKFLIAKIRLVSIGFCVFAAGVASTDLMIHDGLFVKDTLKAFYQNQGCRAKSYYLFRQCLPPASPQINGYLEHGVTILHLLTLVPNLVMVHTLDAVVVLTALCMWQVLKYFIRHSKEITTSSTTALLHYDVLKQLVTKMNAAVGLLTFAAIAISLPFYASWGAIVFSDNSIDWLYLVHVSTYFIAFFTILGFGADFNFKVGEFYGRITAPEISDNIAPNRLTALLMDMHSNQISMRGCGFFVMTYRFFGTILSLIVTYSIIILQFQFSRRSLSNVNCTLVEYIKLPEQNLSFSPTL